MRPGPRLAPVLLVAVAVLSGCESDATGDGRSSGKGFEELPAKDLCAMVTAEQVTEAVDITIEDTSPLDTGSRVINASSCVYDATDDEPLEQVSTMVEELAPELAGEEALDTMFSATDGEKHDYDTVDGLGDFAGFGRNPRAAPGLVEYELGVVTGGYTVRVFAEALEDAKTEVTVEQLRPLAEEILREWDRD